jgi:tol-pal system protein YbgF
MKKFGPSLNGVIALILLAITPFLFAATNPIQVESLEVDPSSGELPYEPPIEESSAVEEPGMSIGETHYQLQILRQEVEELRGLVEDMGYALARIEKTQDDRYLELDSRFQRLNEQLSTNSRQRNVPPARGEETESGRPSDSTNPAANGDPSRGDFVVATQDEKTLYQSSLELIRSRQYDLAITQLQTMIAQYPDGSLAPNAYYWLGEVYAAKPQPDYEAARKALAQVITFFPEHRKVPDAGFKLGKVYHLMGDCVRAKELLERVMDQNPGKSVSKLAETYLRDNIGACN